MLGLTFENVYIKTKDSVRLHMFFVKQVTEALTASSPTVLYFHGNAGNIGHRLMNVKGQLISKCPFDFIVWTKLSMKLFLNFCPEIFCTFLGASWKLIWASWGLSM